MNQKKLPVIIIGGGGHAKVVADVLKLQEFEFLGFTEMDPEKTLNFAALPFLGDDRVISRYLPKTILLGNGVGSGGSTVLRREIYERFSAQGYRFACCIHPSAIVASHVETGEGIQLMAGCVVQPGCSLGHNVIINSGAVVDHDCHIGDHAHIAPGVTLSGSVRVGCGAHIGIGATVIQGISIGNNSLVGAGSIVIRDVADNSKVVGNPAREVSI